MLNKEQKGAVEIIDTPLIVIAGPGTGKTTLITEKIDYLINKKNITSDEILAITFTQKAAQEMSERVEIKFSIPFSAKTFHEFCLDIIEEFESKISEIDKDYNLLDESGQLLFFIENMSQFKFSSIEIKNNSNQIAYELSRLISKLKDFGISLNNLEKVQFKDLNEKVDIFTAFSKYEKYKKENNFIDFADTHLLVLNLLNSNKEILETLKKRYKYILVDEFQDTNKVQLDIIKLLATNNITIVGDSKQSIYSFRGANYKNLDEFKSHFKNFKEIYLHKNYRSSKEVLDSINKVILDLSDKNECLKSNSKELGNVNLIESKSEKSQQTYLLEKITKIKEENPNATIGVLCRRKIETILIGSFLSDFGVEYSVAEINDYFNKEIVQTIIKTLEVIEKPKEANSQLFQLLSTLNVRDETIKKISRKASLNEKSIYNVLQKENLCDYEDEAALIGEFTNKLNKLIELKNTNFNLRGLILELLTSFNLYEKSIIANSKQNLKILNLFVDFTEKFTRIYNSNDLSKFLSVCQLSKNLNLSFETEEIKSNLEILTIHQSKGKEFDYVFIPYINERRFPTTFKNNLFSTPFDFSRDEFLNEEERLFFVAISRAKKELHLIFVKRYSDNKLDSKQSIFLPLLEKDSISYSKEISDIDFETKNDLKIEILKKIENLVLENQFDLAKKQLDILKSIYGKKDLTSFMGDVSSEVEKYNKLVSKKEEKNEIEERIYSVSQIQVYESCPKKYSYQYIYKIPTQPKHYFDFGTSMHTALEYLSMDFDKNYSKEILFARGISYLRKNWISKAYESSEQEKEYLQKGTQAIKDYIDSELELREDNREILEREKRFVIDIEGRKFQGVIDRIDKVKDSFEILDYKTSNSMEDEKNLTSNTQLLVYSMAIKELYKKYPQKIGLWYLIHNKIKSVLFEEKNIEIAKEKILNLIKGIESENFNATPSFFSCKFCDFNTICKDSKHK